MKTAILIDSDNINPHDLQAMWPGLCQIGEIICQRAYGDWKSSGLKFMGDICEGLGIELVQQTVYVTGKNATDMAMTIDAVDLYHQHNIEQVVLLTSDSDFTPLATWLCHRDIAVVGVLGDDASWAFRRACTKVFDHAQISEFHASNDYHSEKIRLLMDTLSVHLSVFFAQKTVFSLTDIVGCLNELDPDFSCMRYNQPTVSALLITSGRWAPDEKDHQLFHPISEKQCQSSAQDDEPECVKRAFMYIHEKNMSCPLYSGYLPKSDVEQQMKAMPAQKVGKAVTLFAADDVHPQRVFHIPGQEPVVWLSLKPCETATFRAKELLLRIIDKQLRLHGQTVLIYPGHLRKTLKELDENFTWAKYGASSFDDLMKKHSDLLLPIKAGTGHEGWSVCANNGLSQYQQLQSILSVVRDSLKHRSELSEWLDCASWERLLREACPTLTLKRAGISQAHCLWWVFSDQIETTTQVKGGRIARFRIQSASEHAA